MSLNAATAAKGISPVTSGFYSVLKKYGVREQSAHSLVSLVEQQGSYTQKGDKTMFKKSIIAGLAVTAIFTAMASSANAACWGCISPSTGRFLDGLTAMASSAFGQSTNKCAPGYIRDTNPFGSGCVQDKNSFGYGYNQNSYVTPYFRSNGSFDWTAYEGNGYVRKHFSQQRLLHKRLLEKMSTKHETGASMGIGLLP
jgi:hypothetical protein